VAAWVSLFRNTPLLVQLLFWYFAAWNLLPLGREILSTTTTPGPFCRATSGG
jgi:ABC-type amino acid transport system permease subunit